MSPVRPSGLPADRGPVTQALFAYWRTGATPPEFPIDLDADLADDDLQLALFCCYELAYRGFRSLPDELEWDAVTLGIRGRLEGWFETRLRADVVLPDAADAEQAVDEILSWRGASVAVYLEDVGDLDTLRDALILRSPYQAKEADPHSWALPRLSGRVKRALADIQAGEYGVGYHHSHAELFTGALAAAGADPAYGAYFDVVPGAWLAITNLISFFGLHRRHRGALVGHLALYELDSVTPSARVVRCCERVAAPPAVTRFYKVHVLADAEHEVLARAGFLRSFPEDEPDLVDDLVFGAAAAWHVDQLAARPTIEAWRAGRSPLRGQTAIRSAAPKAESNRSHQTTSDAKRARSTPAGRS